MAFPLHEERSLVSFPLLKRPPVPSDYGPTLMTSFNLNYVLEGLSPNAITMGVWASTYKFWGDNVQSITVLFFSILESLF